MVDILQSNSAVFSTANSILVTLSGVQQNNSIVVAAFGSTSNQLNPAKGCTTLVNDGNAYASIGNTFNYSDGAVFQFQSWNILSNAVSGTHTINVYTQNSNSTGGYTVAFEVANLVSSNVVDVFANTTNTSATNISTSIVNSNDEIALGMCSTHAGTTTNPFTEPSGFTNLFLQYNLAGQKGSIDYLTPLSNTAQQGANWGTGLSGGFIVTSMIVLIGANAASDNTVSNTYFIQAANVTVTPWQANTPNIMRLNIANTNVDVTIDYTSNVVNYNSVSATLNTFIDIPRISVTCSANLSTNVFSGNITIVSSNTAIAFRVPFVSYNVQTANGNTSFIYKFNPGDYMATEAGEQWPGQTQINAEIDVLANSTNCIGYVFTHQWAKLEVSGTNYNNPSNILQQYPGFQDIANTFNYLQSKAPGSHMSIYINACKVGESLSQSTVQRLSGGAGTFIPAYIGSCGGTLTVPNTYGNTHSTTYTISPVFSGSSYYGVGFAAYNPSSNTMGEVMPAWWNPGVNQCWINMWEALSKYSFLITAGPLTGQTLTLDNNRLIEFVGTNDEYSYSLTGSQNFSGAGAISLNPPLYTNSSNEPTPSNFFNAYYLWLQKVASFFPHTMVVPCFSYGFASIGSDTPGQTSGHLNNYMSGHGFSAITGVTFGDSDTYGGDWVRPYYNANPAKLGYVGIAANTDGGTTPPPVTSTSLIGKMPWIAQVQEGDYRAYLPATLANGAPVTAQTSSCVLSLMQAAAYTQATHRIWCITDPGFQYGNNPNYPWQKWINPTFAANTPHVTITRPSNLP